MGSGGGGGGGFNPIRIIVEKVKDFFGGTTSRRSSSYAREDSYDSQTASLQETMRINQSLTEFRLDIERESDQLERDVIKESRYTLDQFLKSIRAYNNKIYGGRKLNINIDAIERENRDTEDMIHGYIKKRVQKRVSLDDNECLEILKMQKGSQKSAAMKRFMDKVLRDALSDLSNELRKITYKQCDNVIDKIQSRLYDIEESSADAVTQFEAISLMRESDEVGLETKKAEYMCNISMCEYAIAVLK